MTFRTFRVPGPRAALALFVAAGLLQIAADAQDRLKTMPGYEQYQKMREQIRASVRPGSLDVTWTGARTFEYAWEGTRYRSSSARASS